MKKVFILCAGLLAVTTTYAQQEKGEARFTPPVIVKDDPTQKPKKGVSFSIRELDGNAVIYVTKEGKTEKVSMEEWEANKRMYEEKYGKLPPPPPPPVPAVPAEMFPAPPPPPPPPPPIQ